MRKLVSLVEKEVKDLLRDPRIYIGLLVPVVMLPLLGSIMSIAMRSSVEVGMRDVRIAILDYDETEFSGTFSYLLEEMGVKIEKIRATDFKTAVEETRGSGSKALMIIQKGFEHDLFNFKKANIEVCAIVESTGLGSIGAYSTIDAVLSLSSRVFSDILISRLNPNIDSEVIREPLNITVRSIIRDRVLEINPQTLFGQIMMGYGMMVPMMLFILSITVTQLAATATAVENEEKTLETLLTFPVTRYEILSAKLLGSSILAVIGGILFTIGFLFYFESIFTISSFNGSLTNVTQLMPPPPPESFILLAISLILSILFVTSLGVVVGALSSDVRMSNSLLGIIIVPIMIPFFLLIYGDMGALPLAIQLLVYALPTSYPIVIAKEMIIMPMPIEALFGIPYSAILTVLVLYVTSMLLAPEKLLTLQHRLKLRGTKKQKRGLE